jgi:acyl-CoA reductase-like NAD-dependent aldehyde dehydrogenase
MTPLILAGRAHTDGPAHDVVDPHHDRVIAQVPTATPVVLDQAIAAAHRAWPVTRAMPVHARVAVLRRVANLLVERQDALATQLSQEAAKPIDYARAEVARAVETFTFAASELEAARDDVIPLDASPRVSDRWGVTRRFSAGPVSAITPFNFPLNLVAHKVAPAVMAGSPLVIKPAPATPLSALSLGGLLLEAGWPAEALSVLHLEVADAGPLVTDARLAVLSFTGSDTVGWMLKGQAGRKRVLLELGGDAAVLVAPDVQDLAPAVQRVAFGAFAYAGQVCISVQRVLVPRGRIDAFVDALLTATAQVRIGAPEEPGVVMSSLIDDRAVAKVRRIVADTEARGGRRLCGGHRGGRLFDPMVFVDVPADAPLGCEEVFGPAVFVQPYDDFDDAVATINRSRFGLQAGLFTDSLATTTRAFEALEVGALMINDVPTWRVDHMPYGGVKDSGFGREGLRYAYAEYTEERLLVLPKG